RMPKQARDKLSYAAAARLVGEERLKRAGRGSAVSNWKARGVPWDVLGPLLHNRLRAEPPAYDEPAEIQVLEVHIRTMLAPLFTVLPPARRVAVLRHLLTQVSFLADILHERSEGRSLEASTSRDPNVQWEA